MNAFLAIWLMAGCLSAAQQTVGQHDRQVPILCYHNIRTSVEGHQPAYTIDRQLFRQHIQTLADSGYHSITAGQLYDYLTTGAALPDKPVMITFDDNRLEHFTVAAPLLRQHAFKGVFFIMTITIGKPGYMNAQQIGQLSAEGHTIGAHTWDHPDMRKLTPQQWQVQVDLPRQALERITQQPVPWLAYPYGAWNDAAIEQLKARGIKMAFQLTGKTSSTNALYTIRRIEVPGNWSATRLLVALRLRSQPTVQ